MNMVQNEEIQYCRHCGGANKKSAVMCVECEKRLHTIYRPFYDFLKKHTKDEIKGAVTDTVFSCIKNFLLSHVYGVALSVTIVAASVSTIYATQPHIEKVAEVKSAPAVQVAVEQEDPEPVSTPLTEDDFDSFDYLYTNYDGFADLRRDSDPYWEASEYVSDAGELFAENNISGFNYGGVHELISNPITMYNIDIDPAFEDVEYHNFYSDRYMDYDNAVTGVQCTTDIAKALYNDGYQVAECNYVMNEVAGEYSFDTHTGTGIIKKLVYKFVFVKDGDDWYIADDRLVERVNV